jgi:uncharacterized protein YbaP (TraB family)
MHRCTTLFAALFVAMFWPLLAAAQCTGQNLIDALPLDEQTRLRADADAVPYATGNFWRATRGAEVLHLIGTYHFDDARHDATVAHLAPIIAEATVLLVEAGPAEQAAVSERMARDPSLMAITDGPTLPEQLPPAEWASLSSAMAARGVPGFVAAKLQPWFLSMMLGIPPCDMARAASGNGLDERLTEAAVERGVPVRALEPHDVLFNLFRDLSADDQLAMIRAALAVEPQAADMSVTLADAYFAEESRLIWEFTRLQMLATPRADPDRVLRDMALMETALMTRRNRAWIPVLTEAAAKGPVVAAFGALHLSGEHGVLNLLAAKGYTLDRQPLPPQ